MCRRAALLTGFAFSVLLPALGAERWVEMRTPHFDLLTDANEPTGTSLLSHLELVRSLFLAQSLLPEDPSRPTVRVIAFRSAPEYATYRLNEAADAYYVGGASRDYIVMPLTGPTDFRAAAHEYAHLIARHGGLHPPPWLAEGLAEVFSTVHFRAGQAIVGSPDPARLRALLHSRWLPLAQLLGTSPGSGTREQNSMFYAEAWALTHMLLFSPAYSPRFAALLDRCAAGEPAPPVLTAIYMTSLASLERDLRAWLARPQLPSVTLDPAGPPLARVADVHPIPLTDVHLALAELLLASGRRAQARSAYVQLESCLPANPEIPAALGRIDILDGRPEQARDHFRRALDMGIRNAPVCYEYARLAENAGLPRGEVAAALERAVAIDPAFDDARYSLALAYRSAGRYDSALQHLQALRVVPQGRAFAYYTALADTQLELGMRQEAVRSAAEARRYAHSDQEGALAGELAWMAQSEIVVQLSANGAGRLRRIPRGDDWNPFVEPGDHMERREGRLREVDCSSGGLQVTVFVSDQRLVLSVPDPARIQVRQAASGVFEFTCGQQDGPRVLIDYAASSDPQAGVAGILRGLRILP